MEAIYSSETLITTSVFVWGP